ncbi:MAG: DsrE family protein [Burkholderiales bacterium]|nr:DsrE family protein [Burkholderiales bacterium]
MRDIPGKRRFVAAAGTLLAGAFFASRAQATAKDDRPNKLVIQVSDNDPGKWGLALNNAQNVVNDLGASTVALEIVVYGPGIGMLKSDSPMAARIAAALKGGMQIVACENTLKAQKLTHADMLPDIGYVPAGVVELMQKQQQGYAYIRP